MFAIALLLATATDAGGWPDLFPALGNFERKVAEPVVARGESGKRPATYSQSATYEWLGNRFEVITITLARDPAFREKYAADAMNKADPAPEALEVNKKRAYLFHWSYKIVKGKAKASDADAMSGVDIEWDHGDDKASKKGAKEMTDGFGLDMTSTKAPALSSNHIAGNAMDIDISWTGTIKVKKKDGTEVDVKYQANVDSNKELIAVGESYGVKKLKGDPPHWSHDGK